MKYTASQIQTPNRRVFSTILTAAVILIVPLVSALKTPTAFAQGRADIRLKKELLENRYNNQARSLLEKFVQPHEFFVQVNVTPKNRREENLPYLPYGLNAGTVQSLPLTKLDSHIAKLDVTIFLPPRFNAQVQDRIRGIVQNNLGMNPRRGDSISFAPFSIPYEKPAETPAPAPQQQAQQQPNQPQLPSSINNTFDQQLALEKARLENDLRQLQSDRQAIERERNDFRNQLTAVQVQLEGAQQRAREAAAAAAAAAAAGGKSQSVNVKTTNDAATPAPTPAPTEKPQDKDEKDGAKEAEQPNWIAVAGILLIGLLVIGIGFVLAGRAMGGAVGQVANALAGVGSSLERSGGGGGGGGVTTTIAASGPAGLPMPPSHMTGPSGGGAGGGRMSSGDAPAGLPALPKSGSMDAHKLVLQIHDELREVLSRETEPVLIAHVSTLLSHATTRELAVASLEIFGRELANELFNRLSAVDQEEVLRFMRHGRYSRAKVEVLLDAGEMIKTKLLGGMLQQGNRELNPQIATRLANIDDKELTELVKNLHGDLIARLLVYLDPTRIATVCNNLKGKDDRTLDKLVEGLTEIPTAIKKVNLDQQLLPNIDKVMEQMHTTNQKPYMQFYLEVLESAGSELGEKLKNIIPNSKAEIKEFLDTNFITFSTFFRLAMDVREEIVQRLSNVEVASFLIALNENQREQVREAMDQKRWGIVMDELSRYEELTPRQKESSTRFARTQMELRIKEFKGDTPLEDLLEGGAVSQRNLAAA